VPRFHCDAELSSGLTLTLPPVAARHVQVLRLQPGGVITLFNGRGGEFTATVTHMGRSDVEVRVGDHHAVEREPSRAVTLAVGMPANERMDWLVEKATELGVAAIQPLMTERSVLRLKGERADRKREHWQAVAVAACEQCGRNRVPAIAPVLTLDQWLVMPSAPAYLLSLRAGSRPWREALPPAGVPCTVALGPEGGFSPAEEDRLLAAGWLPVGLGAAVLRSETAALAALVTAAV